LRRRIVVLESAFRLLDVATDLHSEVMSYRPFISVVIPTYNRAREVRAAVMSVLAQKYPEYEIIVVDDGSTDTTRESIQQFISQQSDNGKYIRYYCQPNRGPSIARNRGIEEARGEWIAFLDSDDLWLPEKLELQVSAIRHLKQQCGACFTDAQMVNELRMNDSSFSHFRRPYGQPVGIAFDALPSLAAGFCGLWLSTVVVRAELARRINGFDPAIECAEDRDFYFRLALATPLAYINKPLVRTDRSVSPPGSTCRPWDKWYIRLRAHQLMYEKWLKLTELSPQLQEIVARNLRMVHSHWANWYLAKEQYNEALNSISRAMDYEVTANLAVKWMLTRVTPTFARRLLLRAGEDDAVHSR
jgi:glycosyltransferase involved in cell wall biosynthesis